VGFRQAFGEVHERKAKLMRQRLRDLLFGGEVHPYEHNAQAIARTLVLGQGDLQIGLADQPCLDETFADFFTQLSSYCRPIFTVGRSSPIRFLRPAGVVRITPSRSIALTNIRPTRSPGSTMRPSMSAT
jgi:hypothetical protein